MYVDFLPQKAAPLPAGYSSPLGLHSSACEKSAQPGQWPESWVKTQEEDGQNDMILCNILRCLLACEGIKELVESQ